LQHSTLVSAKASDRYLGKQAQTVKCVEAENQIAVDEQVVSFEVISRYLAIMRNSLAVLTLFMCGSAELLQSCLQ